MPYLVDGHNLIPKLGLQLDSLDDEEQLISQLQEFCRLKRVQVQVFFDGAAPGQSSRRKTGSVTAYFVRRGSSADAAIELQLARMGRSVKNWTVVSSDARVQRAARAVHAGVLASEEFAREMTMAQAASKEELKNEATLAPGELEEWMDIFKQKKNRTPP